MAVPSRSAWRPGCSQRWAGCPPSRRSCRLPERPPRPQQPSAMTGPGYPAARVRNPRPPRSRSPSGPCRRSSTPCRSRRRSSGKRVSRAPRTRATSSSRRRSSAPANNSLARRVKSSGRSRPQERSDPLHRGRRRTCPRSPSRQPTSSRMSSPLLTLTSSTWAAPTVTQGQPAEQYEGSHNEGLDPSKGFFRPVESRADVEVA